MATGYKVNGTDLDDLLEPKVGTALSGFSNYQINGTSMTNRFQTPNTDTWKETWSVPYQNGGVNLVGVLKGCLPTQTQFASITSTGTYNISRTDSGITIGSTTYPASSFRNGYVPKIIGVIIAGGGGGAGGWGCDKGDKSGYNTTPGGAGGGGGVVALVLNLTPSLPPDATITRTLTIGSGGGFGGNGSGSSRPSTGGTGGSGTASKLTVTSNYIGSTENSAYGGGGGTGGRGDVARGTGGSGGNHTGTTKLANGVVYVNGAVGGTGGVPGTSNGGGTALTNFSFTIGAGIAKSTMFSNSATGNYYGSGDGYRDSYAGGGCSFGRGASPANGTGASYGGGGATGKNYRNGANGCAFFYY